MNNIKNFIRNKLFLPIKSLFQRVVITVEFYNTKGLANHAAGGAYGFLLSAAPTLLLVSIFLLITFRSAPNVVSGLFQQDIPFLEVIFNENWIMENFIRISRSGIPGVFSVISILWAGRVFAITLQRGLKFIFTGSRKRNPVKENFVTVLIQLGVFIVALGVIISSQTAIYIIENIKHLPNTLDIFLRLLGSHFFPFAALGIISYCAYRVIPANHPKRLSALGGAIFCVIPYSFTFLALQFIINKTRYNFLYGTLGDLIILLVSVYFFFVFFFMGAQFAKVLDSIDVLLFCNLIKVRTKTSVKRNSVWKKIFFSPDGLLAKYLRYYKKGDIIIKKGNKDSEIFFLLDGSAEVIFGDLDDVKDNAVFITESISNDNVDDFSGNTINNSDSSPTYPTPIIEAGGFFGEMEHSLSESRTANVRALSDISVLVLPPYLFDEALDYDTGIDRTVIENLTQRLRAANERRR